MLTSRYVLVFQSDLELAQVCAHALEVAGAATRIVTNLADTIAAVEEDGPDAIVADVDLPTAQCSALVTAIRSFYGSLNLPIVVMSPNSDEPWLCASRALSLDTLALVSSVEHAIERRDSAAQAPRDSAGARPAGPLPPRRFEFLGSRAA